ncbi:site-specific DNA recombinase [Streptacidiphilus sp. MAP12-16]|uniref:recombinase family protein n=1 Tax=Streptacidiphilus sp. MAP12-16 TaxID=3156300 RepID=UPI003516E520
MAEHTRLSLTCPTEWLSVVNSAMERMRPPRVLGPDSVRVAVLVRQSSAPGDCSQASPRGQLDSCLAEVAARPGWHIAGHHVYADIGVSGWTPGVQRAGLAAALAAADAGEFDVLMVYSLSRLTRQGVLPTLELIQRLNRKGVALLSATEPWLDTSEGNPRAEATVAFAATLATYESDNTSAFGRTVAAEVIKRGGHRNGIAPYGMRAEPAVIDQVVIRRLVPDPLTAPWLLRMVEWICQGESIGEIARRLVDADAPHAGDRRRQSWTRHAVRKALRDPRIAGYSLSARRTVPNSAGLNSAHERHALIMYGDDGGPVHVHEGLMPSDKWWRLQERLDHAAGVMKRRGAEESGLLFARTRLLHCAGCGSVFAARSTGERYQCTGHAEAHASAGVVAVSIAAAPLEDHLVRATWTRLAAICSDHGARAAVEAVARRFAGRCDTAEHRTEIRQARTELDQVSAALRQVYQDREDGAFAGTTGHERYLEAVQRLTVAEARLESRVSELGELQHRRVTLPYSWLECATSGRDPLSPESLWRSWDVGQRRTFLAVMIDRVSVAAGKCGGQRGVRGSAPTPVGDRLSIGWVGDVESDQQDLSRESGASAGRGNRGEEPR